MFSILVCITQIFTITAVFGQTKTIVHNHQIVKLTEAQHLMTTNMTTNEVGAILNLQLKDNSGSTGYHWSLSIDNPKVLAMYGEKRISGEKSDEKMVGVPGVYEYQMKLTGKAGKAKITAILNSPTGQSSVKFEHTVKVEAVKKRK
jgi:predicted secreted protein